MFSTAIEGRIPMIQVKTDDTVHLDAVLTAWSPSGKIMHINEPLNSIQLSANTLFWTSNDKLATPEFWTALKNKHRTLLFVNCKPGMMAMDCGWLLPKPEQLGELVEDYTDDHQVYRLVKGMSLKATDELMMLVKARSKQVNRKTVRALRLEMGQSIQGLYSLDTDYDYYEPLPELVQWLAKNRPYLLNEDAPAVLVPRGLMFHGAPGTGKTLAARYLARSLDIPLYRLDTATTLTKYIGESEGRLAQALAQVDRESPCVLLIDEVEKVFSVDGESSVIQRMLTQFLWWLQEHKSRVITVMTCNRLQLVPPELYRSGRVDKVFEIPKMPPKEAVLFAQRLLTETMKLNGKKPKLKQLDSLQALSDMPQTNGWSAAEVSAYVLEQIKAHDWLGLDKPA